MALNPNSKWRLIREVVEGRKTGTLILQSGQGYLHWRIQSGNLLWISSSQKELSFTEFLLRNSVIDRTRLQQAEPLVSTSRSLGSVLLQRRWLTLEQLRDALHRYWTELCAHALQGSTHLFWSASIEAPKEEFVRVDLPLAVVLMSCERSFIETAEALRLVQELRPPLRLRNGTQNIRLHEVEARVLPYLRTGTSLAQILKDPELDHMTCYRILFLLWLTTHLQEPSSRPVRPLTQETSRALQRIRSIPPDWIIPLCVGVLAGILLVPSAPEPPKTEPSAKVESLKQIMQQPAWKGEEDAEIQATEDTEKPHQ